MLLLMVNFRAEPVRAVARIGSAVGTLATVAALWGFDISSATQNAVLVTAPIAIVALNTMAEFMRQFVYPVPIAQEAVAEAMAMKPDSIAAEMTTPAQVLAEVPR